MKCRSPECLYLGLVANLQGSGKFIDLNNGKSITQMPPFNERLVPDSGVSRLVFQNHRQEDFEWMIEELALDSQEGLEEEPMIFPNLIADHHTVTRESDGPLPPIQEPDNQEIDP